MDVLEASLVIAACGAIGGAVGAVLSEGGVDSWLPKKVAGSGVPQPGFVGRVIVGAVAAWLSWALYGPLSGNVALGTGPASESANDQFGLTLAALAGAVGIGIGGAKWLQNYVEKTVLKDATGTALRMAADPALAAQVETLPPVKAAEVVAETSAATP